MSDDRILICTSAERAGVLARLLKKHGKVVIFAYARLLEPLATELKQEGVEVITMKAISAYVLEAFEQAESGILLVSSRLNTGWHVSASGVIFAEMTINRSSAHYIQASFRTQEPLEPYFVNCRLDPHDPLPDSKRWVIYSQTTGVYLGTCLGLGFWTMLDPAGQTHSCVFDSEQQARDHVSSWQDSSISDVEYREIEVANPDHGASIDDVVKAGLPSWDPDLVPTSKNK